MKYQSKYFKPEGMNTKDHFLLGYIWNVEGSKGNSYEIELHPKGFDCNCPGFGFRGKCKHVVSVAGRLMQEDVPEYAL